MIWLTGSKGMLGTELSLLLEKSGLPFVGTDREVDISSPASIRNFTQAKELDWIINCAAYTAVEKAEDDKENCRLLNTVGAANMAHAAYKAGAKLIHLSTDYVFNGRSKRPYTEDDATEPMGVYGLTKRDGELELLNNSAESYIIRTAWVYGKYGTNFVDTMLRLMNERDQVNVVNDQKGSPTWAFDLAATILALIKTVDARNDISFGIYHFTNKGETSWFDFAREIYKQGRALGIIRKDCDVKPCTSAEYPSKVKRPEYSALDTSKIKRALGITIPAWDASLREFLRTNDNS